MAAIPRAETHRSPGRTRQRGVALLVMLALLGVVAALLVASLTTSPAHEQNRQAEAARAMGMIRDALIARAASDVNRPGSLPCPDYDGNGTADGSLCTSPYIGWVPWQTLDLPDLRDAAGQRFWYALSAEFRDHSILGALNSETTGSLTLNGDPMIKYVAIILSPSAPLASQNRDPSNTDAAAVRAQYLDGSNNDGDTNYVTNVASATFNDHVLAITHDALMPVVEQRVARQARECLRQFALQTEAGGRFPFAALLSDTTTFADASNTYAGRLPQTLVATQTARSAPTLDWPADNPRETTERCFQAGTWWDYWRELLFYRVAPAYAPNAATPGCGSCLTVDGAGQVEVAVIVAGRPHSPPESPDQSARPTNKSDPLHYLETAPGAADSNASAFTGGTPSLNLEKRPRAMNYSSSTGYFNDRLECISEGGGSPCN